jgi:cyanophycinase-like exopeptidase
MLSGMPGPVALIGAGEFLAAMADFDRLLLAATASPRPRVAVVPTAAYPDGEEAFRRRAAIGAEHFGALGGEVEAVLVRDRSDADDPVNAQAVGEADLVYFSGGHPAHLLETLAGSRVWAAAQAAHARGAVLAGCAAGAMVLAGRQFILRRPLLALPLRWPEALGVVPGAAVFPRYNAWPEPVSALLVLAAPRDTTIIGIDEETALLGHDGSWQVHGRSRVTVWRGRDRVRHRAGDVFRLPGP